MKGPVRNPSTYQFSASAKTLTFLAPIPTFHGQILGVFNLTRQGWIYLPQKAGCGGTWSSPVLTLLFDTSTHADSDALQVFYDDGLTSQLISGTVTAIGPLTDTELRATPVEVQGVASGVALPVAPNTTRGSGPSTGDTQRVTLASDGPSVTALVAITADLGSPSDPPASSDGGTFPMLPFVKRLATQNSALAAIVQAVLNRLPAELSGGRLLVEPSLPSGAATATNQATTNNRLGTTGTGAPTLPSGAAGLAGLVQVLYQALLNRLPAALSAGRLLVEPSLPEGAATAARQPAIGAAGTPSADVLTVQGDALGVPMPVTNSTPTPTTTPYSNAGAIANGTVVIGPIDCAEFQMVALQTVAVGAGGALRAEWSIDGASRWDPALMLSTATGGAVTAPSTNVTGGSLVSPVYHRWFRVVLTSAVTSGNTNLLLQTFVNSPFSAGAQAVNLLAGSMVGLAPPSATTDLNVTAQTASASSNQILQIVPGIGFMAELDLTASSGSSGTLDVGIDEAIDLGNRWYRIFDFPRITGGATGVYRSPKLSTFGGRIRYVRQVGGAGGSFTYAVSRSFCSDAVDSFRQRFDYAISLTTALSVTATLLTPNCKNAQMVFAVGAITGAAPALQLQNSDDRGMTWYNIGPPLTAVANSAVGVTVNNIQVQEIRAIVTTAGVGVTPNYVLLKGF